jgi:hypothetical protein
MTLDHRMSDPRDQIEQLERRVEELADTAERCRKLMLFARFMIVLGAVVLAVFLLGLMRVDPAVLLGAIAAVLGGIVTYGSNKSTRDGTLAAIAAAEAQRGELIGGIDLRVVDAPATLH